MVLIVTATLLLPEPSYADIESLKQSIDQRNREIEKLEAEIAQYQSQIDSLGKERATLSATIKSLDITDKKLGTDIRITENKISQTSLAIQKLNLEIDLKENQIERNEAALARSLFVMNDLESNTLTEIILLNSSLSEFGNKTQALIQFEDSIRSNLASLKALRIDFEEKKNLQVKEKKNYTNLKDQLLDQKDIVLDNRKAKQELLKQTNNKETAYKKLVNDRLAKKAALEAEIADFEAQIKIAVDPSLLPRTGSGILNWPLSAVTITQYFGNTAFATKNSQIYNGRGHNGIDLRAPIGTPIHAASSGTVVDTGDTDISCYKVSYGRWVLIKHQNGLATLYAHLSLIKVLPGQSVSSGDTIGYSGNTGYSTGPHLHFAVFAAQAVQITTNYRSKVCGSYLKLPVAPQEGYLNPLSYL